MKNENALLDRALRSRNNTVNGLAARFIAASQAPVPRVANDINAFDVKARQIAQRCYGTAPIPAPAEVGDDEKFTARARDIMKIFFTLSR